MRNILIMLCTIVTLSLSQAAKAQGVFQIGAQIGMGDYQRFGDSASRVGGVISGYTIPIGDNGAFLGIQIGAVKTSVSSKIEAINYDFEDIGIIYGVEHEDAVTWSIDVMPRIGYDFGNLSLSLAAGASAIQIEMSDSATGVSGTRVVDKLSETSSKWYPGWKVAPRLDYDLSDHVALFVQAHYAEYKGDYDGRAFGGRFGIAYNF